MLGIRRVADGPDWVELACPFSPDFLLETDGELSAAGPIYSLVDAAAGAAIIARVGGFRPLATLDLRIDHLRPALAGEPLHARARCYHLTRQVAFIRCDVHHGAPGDPIAFASGSFFFTSAS